MSTPVWITMAAPAAERDAALAAVAKGLSAAVAELEHAGNTPSVAAAMASLRVAQARHGIARLVAQADALEAAALRLGGAS